METSAPGGGVALWEDGGVVAAERLGAGQRHGQELLPACRRALAAAGWMPAALDGVAVSAGPGSYTGLRIGAMAAKALAYAAGPRLAPVSSLHALAATAAAAIRDRRPRSAPLFCFVVQSARRDEVYAAAFLDDGPADAAPVPLPGGERAMSPEEARDWARSLQEEAAARDGTLALAGTALADYPLLWAEMPSTVLLPDLGAASAEWVARLGREVLRAGRAADPLTWQPAYPRRDEADAWRRDALIAAGAP